MPNAQRPGWRSALAFFGPAVIFAMTATTTHCLAGADARNELRMRVIEAPTPIEIELDTDLLSYDLCWSDNVELSRETLALRIAQASRDEEGLVAIHLPQLPPTWVPIRPGAIFDLQGKAIDRRRVEMGRRKYTADLSAALVDVLERVRELLPDGPLMALVGLDASQADARVYEKTLAAVDYICIEEELREQLRHGERRRDALWTAKRALPWLMDRGLDEDRPIAVRLRQEWILISIGAPTEEMVESLERRDASEGAEPDIDEDLERSGPQSRPDLPPVPTSPDSDPSNPGTEEFDSPPAATPSPHDDWDPRFDLDGDGDVDEDDAAVVLAKWGTSDPNADVNDDGTVNSTDLSMVLANAGSSAPDDPAASPGGGGGGGGGGSGGASAFPPCLPLPIGGVDPWINSPRTTRLFTPDRRPIISFSVYLDGAWQDGDDNGAISGRTYPQFVGNGIPDSIDWLLEALDHRESQGWRRIVLFLPGGQLAGQGRMSSSQYWTMPEWKREALNTHLRAWIAAHPHVELGVYGGWRLVDPCSLCMGAQAPGCEGVPEPKFPSAYNAVDAAVAHQNLQPWIDLGFKTYWFDAVRTWEELDILRSVDRYAAMKFGGEPLPKHPRSDRLDQARLRSGAYVITTRYLSNNLIPNEINTDTFDPQTTEVCVVYQGSSRSAENKAEYLEEVKRNFDSGLVAWSGTSMTHEAVMRVYWPTYAPEFRTDQLIEPADLNMDGVVDSADRARIISNLGMNSATLYYGDITGDGRVDQADIERFDTRVTELESLAGVSTD